MSLVRVMPMIFCKRAEPPEPGICPRRAPWRAVQIRAYDYQRLRSAPKLIQEMSDVLGSRITDQKWYYLEGRQDCLQERQLNFQGMLGRVGRVGLGDEFQTAYFAASLGVHSHTTKGSCEGLEVGAAIPLK